MTAESQADTYRVLFVCTGNICRSPFAEGLFRDAVARIGDATGDARWGDAIVARSAGTHAMVGNPIDADMAGYFVAHGSTDFGHVASQLDRDLVAESDLVLALSREHRRDVVRILPNASRRVFTLGEFVRLLDDAGASGVIELGAEDSPSAQMAAIVEAVASRRGFTPAPEDPAIDDVIDPYRRASTVYAGSAAQIATLIGRVETGIVTALRAAE